MLMEINLISSTVSVCQIFVQTILICNIDIQQADSMKKLSKMINYCHFSVAESIS